MINRSDNWGSSWECMRKAIQSAGTTDGRQLIPAIRAGVHDGALGHIRFDVKGDVQGASYVIWKVEGGTWRQIR